jgi:very-short-patch-repair endonuclease
MAACLWAGGAAAASHRAAAALWRLNGFEPSAVEISTPYKIRRHGNIQVHRALDLASVDRARIAAIPVTTVPRTLLDLGAVSGTESIEEALEDALRRGLVSLPRLRWTLERLGRKGRPGTAALRKLLEQRPGGRQFRVRDGGRVVARVDFAYPSLRLAIDVDGYQFHSARSEWQRDRRLQNALTLLGWRLLRVTSDDIDRRPEQVVDEIRAVLNDRRVDRSTQ